MKLFSSFLPSCLAMLAFVFSPTLCAAQVDLASSGLMGCWICEQEEGMDLLSFYPDFMTNASLYDGLGPERLFISQGFPLAVAEEEGGLRLIYPNGPGNLYRLEADGTLSMELAIPAHLAAEFPPKTFRRCTPEQERMAATFYPDFSSLDGEWVVDDVLGVDMDGQPLLTVDLEKGTILLHKQDLKEDFGEEAMDIVLRMEQCQGGFRAPVLLFTPPHGEEALCVRDDSYQQAMFLLQGGDCFKDSFIPLAQGKQLVPSSAAPVVFPQPQVFQSQDFHVLVLNAMIRARSTFMPRFQEEIQEDQFQLHFRPYYSFTLANLDEDGASHTVVYRANPNHGKTALDGAVALMELTQPGLRHRYEHLLALFFLEKPQHVQIGAWEYSLSLEQDGAPEEESVVLTARPRQP